MHSESSVLYPLSSIYPLTSRDKCTSQPLRSDFCIRQPKIQELSDIASSVSLSWQASELTCSIFARSPSMPALTPDLWSHSARPHLRCCCDKCTFPCPPHLTSVSARSRAVSRGLRCRSTRAKRTWRGSCFSWGWALGGKGIPRCCSDVGRSCLSGCNKVSLFNSHCI